MRSLCRIFGVRWRDHVAIVDVRARTRVDDVELRIRRRQMALFEHVARMTPGVPAHDTLQSAMCGSVPGQVWMRPRGRSRKSAAALER